MLEQPLTMDNPASVTFTVDAERRTIKGLALPFGDVASSKGQDWTFSKGSLTWGKVTVLDGHDWTKALGTAQLEETDEGVYMTAKIARGARGDEALALAEDGVYDGLSAGLGNDLKAVAKGGVQHVTSGTIREVSLTPIPSFARAQITSVAASAAHTESETIMEDDKTTETEAPVSFSAAEGQALMTQVQAMSEEIAALKEIKIPVGPDTAQFSVTEEPIYRFSGSIPAPSGYDFAEDVLAAGKDGDGAALERLKTFTAEHFGPQFADQPITTGDVAAVNQSVYRPDMFLGQAPVPASPLYDCFHKGAVASVTPFFWSKLDRDNTDIGIADHTENTAQETRDLVTASGATVTPVPVSGRAFITREVADQGGNPQVSGLVWSEFDRSFRIALETKTAALISAASITELGEAIAAGADGATAGAAVEAGLVGLQFLADGFRFSRVFGHVELYKVLAAAQELVPVIDSTDEVTMVATGKKLYPIVNPSNVSGQAASKWSSLSIGGYDMQPAASLGAAGTGQKSIVADPNAVHVWNSGLTRLDRLQETVEGWQMATWGYFAGVVYDVTGLRKITYDGTA
jgi:HK97 family phage prohead protease